MNFSHNHRIKRSFKEVTVLYTPKHLQCSCAHLSPSECTNLKDGGCSRMRTSGKNPRSAAHCTHNSLTHPLSTSFSTHFKHRLFFNTITVCFPPIISFLRNTTLVRALGVCSRPRRAQFLQSFLTLLSFYEGQHGNNILVTALKANTKDLRLAEFCLILHSSNLPGMKPVKS